MGPQARARPPPPLISACTSVGFEASASGRTCISCAASAVEAAAGEAVAFCRTASVASALASTTALDKASSWSCKRRWFTRRKCRSSLGSPVVRRDRAPCGPSGSSYKWSMKSEATSSDRFRLERLMLKLEGSIFLLVARRTSYMSAILPGFKCWKRRKHSPGVRPGRSCRTRHQFPAPYFSMALMSVESSSLVQGKTWSFRRRRRTPVTAATAPLLLPSPSAGRTRLRPGMSTPSKRCRQPDEERPRKCRAMCIQRPLP
mmetsp:Transcript_87165/g.186946  ORF Transcript_87165/g.186946 Transcript_87165/m.186946 type:complete len:260 (-) Transcript_87165:1150-1929(-)